MLYVNVKFTSKGATYQYHAYQRVRAGDEVIVQPGIERKVVEVISVSRRKTFEGETKEILGVVKTGWFRWLFPLPAKVLRKKAPPGFFLDFGPEDFDLYAQDNRYRPEDYDLYVHNDGYGDRG